MTDDEPTFPRSPRVPARSAKGLATREKILQAANDLFYLHGYNATGLDRIIATAGVVKGNFYHHFKSKEELAAAVIAWHRDRLFGEVEAQGLLEQRSARDALLGLLEHMVERAACDVDGLQVRGCFFGNFALELAGGSDSVRQAVQEVFAQIRALLTELLARGIATAELRADLDPAQGARMILGLMEGATLLDKAHQTQDEARAAIDFIRSYVGA